MAYIEFGHTWWGQRWLQSLTNIDHANRIPRGKRYARNGSVSTITVAQHKSGNQIGNHIEARVQGRRAVPYRVQVVTKQLSEKEKNQIVELVQQNAYYLSQLETGSLPPELEQECLDRKISLFPTSWKDLGMHCSCPDWAVPCKHIAAVIYMIANEIDKDPFLIFRLHGLDLIHNLHTEEDHEQESIPTLESLTRTDDQGTLYGTTSESSSEVDLSLIPNTLEALERILTASPLFCPTSDFKRDLLKYSTKMARAISPFIENMEVAEEDPNILYDSCRITMKGNLAKGYLALGKKRLHFSHDDMNSLLAYLQQFPATNLEEYPPVLSLLIVTHSFALRLLEQGSAVPDILSLGAKTPKTRTATKSKKQTTPPTTYTVRWIPALFNPEIRTVTDQLAHLLATSVKDDLLFIDKEPAEKRQQILLTVSLFMQGYQGLIGLADTLPETDEHDLFFRNTPYTPRTFSQQGNPKTMHLWLGRLFIRPATWHPVICLEQGRRDTFICEIKVATDKTHPISLAEFLRESPREDGQQAIDGKERRALLRDLGLLGTYLDIVSEALREGGTISVSGDEFLHQWFNTLPILKTLGIRTIIPKSLREAILPQTSVRLRTKEKDSVVNFLSLKNMLSIEWTITAGDVTMSLAEFEALRGESRRYVHFKDQYLELDEKQLDRIAKRLERPAKLTPIEMLKAGLTGTYDGQPVEMDDAVKACFDGLFTIQPAPVPTTLNAELRPYQVRGYQWLYHNYTIGLGSVLADDMGLGKTIQIIALLLQLHSDKVLTAKRPAIIVVPASLVTNWLHEIARFAPTLTAEAYHGNDRELTGAVDVVVTTYAIVRRDSEQLKKRFSLAIIDEAQNIKNPETAQSKAVRSLQADYTIAMTGTPVENRMLDYWSILDTVMKGYVGSRKSFKVSYALPIERYRDQQVLETFKRITAPLVLRRLKTDTSIIDDLPEKLVSNRYTTLTVQQKVLYEEVVSHTESVLSGVEGIAKAGAVFKLMTALKQVCCHPALYADSAGRDAANSGKAEMLLDLLETIHAREEKVLIFTQYAQMGFLLQELIHERFGTPGLFLHGGSSRTQRDAMVNAFQNDLDQWAMILSIRAGGTGLNLTAASHVIHYDLWWNPAVENQATDRAFRIGQDKQVTVHRLITQGTFEEQINQMIESKQHLAESAVTKGEQWITQLPPDELKELIRLRE